MTERSPQDVTPKAFFDEHPDAVPMAAISIVEYMDSDGEHLLATCRDTDNAIWAHLGMIESMRGDLKADLLKQETD